MKQDTKFADSDQYQQMIESFNGFYQKELNQITKEIDVKHLSIARSESKSELTESTSITKSTSLFSNKWKN